MNNAIINNFKIDLTLLFDKFNLLNLWTDLIKIISLDLNYFLRHEGKNFFNKLKILFSKYGFDLSDKNITLTKEKWIIQIKISDKQNILLTLPYRKWNYHLEKEKKMNYLKKNFHNEIKKLNKIKKYILNQNQKVLIYPIYNQNFPTYPISELINKKFLYNLDYWSSKINVEKLLLSLNICSKEKFHEFYQYLIIIESRFIMKIENELIPLIENISWINSKYQIDKIYYFDSPDFILINNHEAIGVEVTNIKHRKNYFDQQSYKENLLRNLINPNCFYSKKFFIYKQQKKYLHRKQHEMNTNYKIRSLSRHFSNNSKYNETIRDVGLKVRRGQKNFYILNGWDKNGNLYERKLIKNIAIKKNIPFNRLIFFDINYYDNE